MKLPFQNPRERWIALGMLALWALLFLPNLRTNPGWYGDEGEWMEKSWTFIHGTPRVGPIKNDFVFPYPYPPLYMLINGALLCAFGNDIVVARGLGAVTALAAAAILFWVGTRLRDKNFGFLCAAAFLVYSEANMNFRWVRSHPMAGTLALASVGFLIRYVQEKRLRDIALAGLMCSLATAANYFTYPLIGAVIVTGLVVNWRHAPVAAATAGAYGVVFALWYCAAHGWGELMAQVGRLMTVASNEVRPTFFGEVARFGTNVWTLGFNTPTQMDPLRGWSGRDWWLVIATAGFVFLPVANARWLRAWLPFWLLVLMYGVFKKLNNVPLFFYPATILLPLMAVGFAGVITWAATAVAKWKTEARWVPAFVVLVLFALPSARGAWSYFESKIARWTQRSVPDAEAAMRHVNERIDRQDFVIVPKQIYWLARCDRRSMLTFCARYKGVVNDMPVGVEIPTEYYWFDCRLENAKFLVLEYGAEERLLPDGRRLQLPVGIDAAYTVPVLRGVREILMQTQQENWPATFQQGAYIVLANPRFEK